MGEDIITRVFEHFEKTADAQKNITIENGYIVIRESRSFSYEIPLEDCCTVWGALDWILHMMEKNWVTEEKLTRIAGLMSSYAKEHHSAKRAAPKSEDNGL